MASLFFSALDLLSAILATCVSRVLPGLAYEALDLGEALEVDRVRIAGQGLATDLQCEK